MEQLIKNIIPSIKQYGELLSQKSILQKTWLLVNDDDDLVQYTFKKDGELIISINGDVTKGKWELLSSTKILLESPRGSIQLESLFFNNGIIVLLKLSKENELLILIDMKELDNRTPIKYLEDVKSNFERDKRDENIGWLIFVICFIIIAIFFSLAS